MPTGISLHIGMGAIDAHHYLGWSGIAPACEKDAKRIESLAKARGFSSSLFLTKDAIADHVIDAIKKAASTLQTGDILLITYAGHGTTLPDTNGDEATGEDDVWALYDRMLIDDELYTLWNSFKPGVRVAVITDSCTNGSVISVPLSVLNSLELDRPEQLHVRAVPTKTRNRVYEANKAFYDGIQNRTTRNPPASTVLLIASSRDGEPSFDNGKYGFFTDALIKTWNNGAFTGKYQDLYLRISDQIRAYENPTIMVLGPPSPNFPDQRAFTI